MGLALGITLKFYANMTKWSELKNRKFWGLVPGFFEVIVGKLVGGAFLSPAILNRVDVNMISAGIFLCTIGADLSRNYAKQLKELRYYPFLNLLELLGKNTLLDQTSQIVKLI